MICTVFPIVRLSRMQTPLLSSERQIVDVLRQVGARAECVHDVSVDGQVLQRGILLGQGSESRFAAIIPRCCVAP
jgi:hypothetical protein